MRPAQECHFDAVEVDSVQLQGLYCPPKIQLATVAVVIGK
jgi:hypothetical protein